MTGSYAYGVLIKDLGDVMRMEILEGEAEHPTAKIGICRRTAIICSVV